MFQKLNKKAPESYGSLLLSTSDNPRNLCSSWKDSLKEDLPLTGHEFKQNPLTSFICYDYFWPFKTFRMNSKTTRLSVFMKILYFLIMFKILLGTQLYKFMIHVLIYFSDQFIFFCCYSFSRHYPPSKDMCKL